MSNESIFMTEIEAKRLHYMRIKKRACTIKYISFIVALLTIYNFNNGNLKDSVMVIILVLSIIGVYAGCALQSSISKYCDSL